APYANRPPALARLGGLTMEQLFVKVELEDGETFASLAEKVRTETVSTLRHSQYCVSDRGVSSVMLNLLSAKLEPFADLGVELDLREAYLYEEELAGRRATPRNLLAVNVYQFGEQSARLALSYHAATFPEATRLRAQSHFLRVLEAM